MSKLHIKVGHELHINLQKTSYVRHFSPLNTCDPHTQPKQHNTTRQYGEIFAYHSQMYF